MNLAGFEWDRGNREKCQKHGVSIEEIEAMLRTARVAPDMKHSQAEDRFIATGRNSKGRPMFVAFVFPGESRASGDSGSKCPLHASKGSGAL